MSRYAGALVCLFDLVSVLETPDGTKGTDEELGIEELQAVELGRETEGDQELGDS